MAVVNIAGTLGISVSTNGLSPLQSTSPAQLFTPATGQRAFTFADAIGSLTEQIGGNTDPTSKGADSPDSLYNFESESDGIGIVDSVQTVKISTLSKYDIGMTYLQGQWQ